MGAELKKVKTAGGVEVLRVEADGLFDEATTAKVVPAIIAAELPVLMLLGSGIKISAGARKSLFGLDGGGKRSVPVALVAKSGLMRAMISMVIKGISIAKRHEVTSATFADEASAIAWLDQQPRLQAA